MNCTLIPVCSSFLPSRGRIVTDPLTVSPSKYSGYFSRRPLSDLMSTCSRWSSPLRRISMSRGDLKKSDMMGWRGDF